MYTLSSRAKIFHTCLGFVAVPVLISIGSAIYFKLKSFRNGENQKASKKSFGRVCEGTIKMLDLTPTQQVIRSSKFVVNRSKNVTIVEENSINLMHSIIKDSSAEIEWDASGWHFTEDVETDGVLTCQYIFVLDALNFCFWPEKGLEYENLAVSLTEVLRKDHTAFSAEKLMIMTPSTLQQWLPNHSFPLIDARVEALQDLGSVLVANFGGLAVNLVKCAEGSVVRLVRIVTSLLPGFRDEAIYQEKQIFFYKRAQILAGDIWGAFKNKVHNSTFVFDDIDQLTMFADYRVPQLLRHFGVLEYSPYLSNLIDSLEEISAGGEMEIEIRASTIVAVENLKKQLKSFGINKTSVEIDWFLWQMGEALKDSIAPAHRVRTIFY